MAKTRTKPAGPRAVLKGRYRDDARYPMAMVNITNHCNLACAHCFIYRDGNPNRAPIRLRDEMNDDDIVATLTALRDRHGIASMLWMGGEPLLKPKLLRRGVGLFQRNTITTNGTAPLIDFGKNLHYVVSIDGPEELNDALRGPGVFRRVLANLAKLPTDFASSIQVQCVVTRRNQDRLAELVETLKGSRVAFMTFSFYVPRANDDSDSAWPDNAERARAVREVLRLKAEHGAFIRNSRRSLELMLPPDCDAVVAACPAAKFVLPLWLERDFFVTPDCCYGNDVDCARCGAWVVFHLAAKMEAGVDLLPSPRGKSGSRGGWSPSA